MDEYETQISSPLDAKPYDMVAWSRIGELIDAIEHQYEAVKCDAKLVELWAKEIVLQAKLIGAMKGST